MGAKMKEWGGGGKQRNETLAFFLECQLALFVVIFVFASASIFPSLIRRETALLLAYKVSTSLRRELG